MKYYPKRRIKRSIIKRIKFIAIMLLLGMLEILFIWALLLQWI